MLHKFRPFSAQRSLLEVVGNNVELSGPPKDDASYWSAVLWPIKIGSGPTSKSKGLKITVTMQPWLLHVALIEI